MDKPNDQSVNKNQQIPSYDQRYKLKTIFSSDDHKKLSLILKIQNSITQINKQAHYLSTCKGKSFKPQIFYSKFYQQQNFSNSHLKNQFKIHKVSKTLPFHISMAQSISVSQNAKIFKCQFKDIHDQQNTLETLAEIKQTLDQKDKKIDFQTQKYTVDDQTFQSFYYHALQEKTLKESTTIKQVYQSKILPLKCKIINLRDFKSQQVRVIHNYLQKLKFFYEYKDKIHGQNYCISSKRKQQKSKLKLFYFNFINQKQFQPTVLKDILKFIKINQKVLNANNSSDKGKQITTDTLIECLLKRVVDQNWQIRQKAYQILQTIINTKQGILNEKLIELICKMINEKQLKKKKFVQFLVLCVNKILKMRQNAMQKTIAFNMIDLLFVDLSVLIGIKSFQYGKVRQNNNQQKQKEKQQKIKNLHLVSQELKIQFIMANLNKFQISLGIDPQTYSYQPKQITFNLLDEIFSENYVKNLSFSDSLNLDQNQKLQAYQSFVNQYKIKTSSSGYKDDFLYIITEYHHGKNLKQLILANWKGFQNHSTVHKLATKLFWTLAQLEYFGIENHVATLQSIIIYENQENPHCNVNMTSSLKSLLLINQNDGKSVDKKSQRVIKRSFLEQLLLFFDHQKVKSIKNGKINHKSLDKIGDKKVKFFLSILMFIVCRRLGHFQDLQVMFKQLKTVIAKNIQQNTKIYQQIKQKYTQKEEKQKQKQKQKDKPISNQESFRVQDQRKLTLQEQIQYERLKALYDESSQFNLKSTLSLIMSNKNQIQKEHFANLEMFIPQLYSKFLEKYHLPKKVFQRIQMISYQNSNVFRINEFQKFLGLQKDQLLQTLQSALCTSLNGDSMPQISWSKVFSLLFTQGKQRQLKQSKLLDLMGEFFDDVKGKRLPAEIYFAIKFDIDFCYFQERYNGKWFECFEVKESQDFQYDIQTIFLLRNIKSQVVKESNILVKQIIRLFEEKQNTQNTPKSEQIIKSKEEKQKIFTKLSAASNLLRYLNNYEKRVYQKVNLLTESNQKSQQKIQQHSENQEKLQYFTTDYYRDFQQDDINELQELLKIFKQKILTT